MRKRVILLTGAAGSIGRETTAELTRHTDRFEIRTLDLPLRRTRARLRPYRDRVTPIWGDIRDRSLVARAMEGVDAVIHLAAVIPPRADHETAHAQSVNVEGTRTLVAAAEAENPGIRFVYSSSISVYGDRVENPWIKVGDPLRPSPHDHYAETKIEAERILRESRLPWTILRLSAVFAPDMRMNPLMFHMPLDTSLEIVTTRDCGYALVRSLDADELVGGTYNLAGGPTCRTTYRACLDRVLKTVGLGERFLPENAFAGGNFHCGFYEDSDELEELLVFQRDSVEDFYDMVAAKTPRVQRALTAATRPLVRWFLLRASEPYRARRRNDPILLERFRMQA